MKFPQLLELAAMRTLPTLLLYQAEILSISEISGDPPLLARPR